MPKLKLSNTDAYPKHIVSRYGKVHIYKNTNRGNWVTYVVAWSVGKKRQRVSFSDELAAQDHAELVQEQLKNGEPLAAKITSSKALYYESCEQKLNGVSLIDAVEYYLAMHGGSGIEQAVSIEKLVEEYLKSVAKAGNDERDIQTVRSHLSRFSSSMKVPIESIRAVDIDRYLESPKDWANRTRNNHKQSISRLFNWAVEKGYLPSNFENPTEKATRYKVVSSGSPGIFTPQELQKLFDHVEEDWMPYLAIAAFAGPRSAEIPRLDWSAVLFDEKVIVLEEKHTKTKRRRVAHMPDNLVDWLKSYRGEMKGPICPAKNSNKMTGRLSKSSKVEWKHNGLRHSYISYQMAILRDAAKVAEQCGNSPDQVQANYKANAVESEARKWFAIRPKIKKIERGFKKK
jgi:integrase